MQELLNKVAILAKSAKFDASCASSGSRRNNAKGLVPDSSAGICHSWSADGRCISLLKLLYSNACRYDCLYCINRRSNDLPRTTLTPDELADITLNFYRRNYIEGLFLSTAVYSDPNTVMEDLLVSLRLLRGKHQFGGYIHVKVVPGTDPILVERIGFLADRLSVNIELPSQDSLSNLAPDKTQKAILAPMEQAARLIDETRQDRPRFPRTPAFAPAGQSTQVLIGASPESDREILSLSENLYRDLALKRVFYSAYVPVSNDHRLPALTDPPLLREHRLYQADWLLRFYGFAAIELFNSEQPKLDLAIDPKAHWALRHPELFPIEVNRADYEMLLRVPGIGVRSARRIVQARRVASLNGESLRQLGIVMKRAQWFLTARGSYLGQHHQCWKGLYRKLAQSSPNVKHSGPLNQLELFPTKGALGSLNGSSGDQK